mgnify:FL=1
MLYITVPDMNDSVSSIVIDEVEYLIRFTYNGTGDYWSFGISTIDDEPIVAMTKIVPNFPITHFFNYTDLPYGIFGALSSEDRIGRDDFNSGKAEFVFIPWSEAKEG